MDRARRDSARTGASRLARRTMLTAFAWVIPPLAILAGWMTWTRLPAGVEEGEDRLERAFATGLCAVFLLGMIGLLLAELGILRPAALATALGAVGLGLWRLLPPRAPSLHSWSFRDFGGAAIVAVLAGAAAAPASEELLGGRDPGVYANTGSWLAREGTLRIHSEALTTIPDGTRQLFYAANDRGRPQVFLLGFFVAGDGASGEVVPQFLHLLPVYLAIGHWLGGTTGAFLVPPLFGVLAVLAVFFSANRLLGLVPAIIAAALLSLNLAQIWAMRNPITECATQLGIFSALWCIGRAHTTGGTRWGVLGALALGVSLLVRIDSLLLVPALVPPLLILHSSATPAPRWVTRALLPLMVLFAVWGTAHGRLFSPMYIRELGTFIATLWVSIAFVLAVAVALLFARSSLAMLLAGTYRWGRALWSIAAAVLAAAFVFGMWVRPHLQPFARLGVTDARTYDEETLVRVAWYFSLPGMLAGFAGVLVLAYRWIVKRRVEWAPFLSILLAFSCLYFWRQMIFPDHPWAMRRYLPVIVPGVCVAIAAAAAALWSLRGRSRLPARAASVAIVAIVVLHEVGMARPFWNFTEKQGVVTSLDRMARLVPRDAVMLFTYPGPDMVAVTPLALHSGRNVLPVVRRAGQGTDDDARRQQFEAQVVRWMRTGRPIVYLTADDGDAPYATVHVRWESVGIAGLTVRTFGAVERHPPRAPISYTVQYHVLRAVPDPEILPACAPRALRADAVLLGMAEGFYQLDTRRSVRHRWVRPRARLVFPPCDRTAGRPRLLRVRATCGPRAPSAGCPVAVEVNGLPAGHLTLTDEWSVSDLPIPEAAAAAPTGAFDIRFGGPRLVPADAGPNTDRRERSFRFASVALVPGAGDGATNAGAEAVADAPRALNLISPEAEDIWGVRQDGFHAVERSDGRMFRWTGRLARVVVPLGRSRPRAVHVELFRTILPGHSIGISANGCRLFEGVPPRSEWDAVLPLDACNITGDELTLAIEAAAVRPPSDRRELAVAVRSIRVE